MSVLRSFLLICAVLPHFGPFSGGGGGGVKPNFANKNFMDTQTFLRNVSEPLRPVAPSSVAPQAFPDNSFLMRMSLSMSAALGLNPLYVCFPGALLFLPCSYKGCCSCGACPMFACYNSEAMRGLLGRGPLQPPPPLKISLGKFLEDVFSQGGTDCRIFEKESNKADNTKHA